MELPLLISLDPKSGLPPTLLPVQDSWSTERWDVTIARYPLHPGLVPQAYSFVHDPNLKTREVLAMRLGHRRGSVYMYTKGRKEEVSPKSREDSVLCVEDAFLSKLVQAKVLSKPESIIELNGSVHKRDGMTFFQALLKESDGSHSLLFHLRIPYSPPGANILQMIHSGLAAIPITPRDAAKLAKDTSATSILFPAKLSPSTAPTPSSNIPSTSQPSSSSTQTDASMNVDQSTPTPPISEAELLSLLPSYFTQVKHIYLPASSPKMVETTSPASVSLQPSPHPYLTTESHILRGRDRRSEEDLDRAVALCYFGLIFSQRPKEK